MASDKDRQRILKLFNEVEVETESDDSQTISGDDFSVGSEVDPEYVVSSSEDESTSEMSEDGVLNPEIQSDPSEPNANIIENDSSHETWFNNYQPIPQFQFDGSSSGPTCINVLS